MDKSTSLSLEKIDLIVYDFDGVMTDNRVLILEDGTEGVFVNRADGLAVKLFKEAGVTQIIISTEANPVVEARAKKISIPILYKVDDKYKTLKCYCMKNGYKLDRVLYVGNDINDLEAMQAVGFPITPADAHPSVKQIAAVVLNKSGGCGVIRELADLILS